MPQIDKYDLMLKMLEIIAQESKSNAMNAISSEQRERIVNIIGDVSGINFVNDPNNVEIGDRFQDINQSHITNRSSITNTVNKSKHKELDLSLAIEKLAGSISKAPSTDISDEDKNDYLEVLNELKQTTTNYSKPRFKVIVLSKGLLDNVLKIESIKDTVNEVRPVIESLWN